MSQAKKLSGLPQAAPSHLIGLSESGQTFRLEVSNVMRRYPSNSNLDDCTSPGIYRFSSNVDGRPEGVTMAGSTLIVESHTANYAQQTLICSMWGSRGIYVRNMMAGKWCAWGKIEFSVEPSIKPEE